VNAYTCINSLQEKARIPLIYTNSLDHWEHTLIKTGRKQTRSHANSTLSIDLRVRKEIPIPSTFLRGRDLHTHIVLNFYIPSWGEGTWPLNQHDWGMARTEHQSISFKHKEQRRVLKFASTPALWAAVAPRINLPLNSLATCFPSCSL
jgi:hypothetical protein